ncbi:MAG TPA: protein kinase [Thermoanaerobaculia bacterium]|nr:protein kinase [Thermoanaerobaculia bacterium]
MTLSSGSRLGPYEIVSPIGAGGMGEVYRARDVRLHREVAVKVLPGSFADDPDRLRRFEQEARAASALNHPGILTIHDFGEHDGSPYVVSELLDGQNLRERMAGSALPVRKVLDYAIQIALGLAAVHEKGIVHRDLKPENVFVTKDGRVKILDFGLAKLMRPELAGEPVTESPTLGTEPGAVLGTVGYMSPEQVRGLAADQRSDVFSFGSVLSEMLTGERAFRGGSAVETMSAILREEPVGLSEPSGKLPPVLVRVVNHCLEKEPSERFQSIRDVAFQLESLSTASAPSAALAAAAEARPARGARWVFPTVAALAALALGFLVGTLRKASPASSPVQAHRLTDFAGLEESPAISPDAKSVAFAAYVGDKRQIWVRLVARGAPLQITRDDADHQAPRWAPDGASLVYYSPPAQAEPQGTVWEIPALGGSPRRIASSIGSADVSHDGQKIAFFRFQTGRIDLVVSARDGGGAKVIAQFPLGSYYLSPRWSPDDRSIAYQSGYVFGHDVFVVSADGGKPRKITREGRLLSGFCWTADGSGIVYSSARGSTILYLPTFNLWTVGLDGDGLRPLTFGEASYVDPDLDATGTVVAGRVLKQFNIWKFPVDGSAVENVRRGAQITRQTGQVQTPSIGGNDRELVYLSDSGGHGNLWVVDTETSASRQITYEQDPGVGLGVSVWSPDGRHIAFVSTRNLVGDVGIWLVNPDGSNLRNLVPRAGWASWSRDGRWLYHNEGSGSAGPIKKIRPEGGTSVLVRSEKGNRTAISPDGSTLYFVVERPTVSGGSDYELRAATPENGPSRVLARIPARRIPLWQLVHPVISPDGNWLAMPLTDGPTTNIWALSTSGGEMRQLTDFGSRPTFIARRVSWSVDGRFLFAALGEGDADVVLLRGLAAGR